MTKLLTASEIAEARKIVKAYVASYRGSGPPPTPITEEEITTLSTDSKTRIIWNNAEAVAKHARRVLLYGPPGTGKSYLARTAGIDNGKRVHPVMVHTDLPAAELRGHFIPKKDGSLEWRDGPAIAAWRDGGRLVLDEIDKAGDDALSFLLAILDDAPTALLEIGTTEEILKPHPNFTVWATMNGLPSDLPPALIDRFPVSIKITGPHPKAVEALDHDLRGMAINPDLKDGSRQLGIRTFMEFQKLRKDVHEDIAGAVVFGESWKQIKQGMDLARKADQR